eukprot:12419722-Karenia_brevis.AAC.1
MQSFVLPAAVSKDYKTISQVIHVGEQAQLSTALHNNAMRLTGSVRQRNDNASPLTQKPKHQRTAEPDLQQPQEL